jgi:hypothetical protein
MSPRARIGGRLRVTGSREEGCSGGDTGYGLSDGRLQCMDSCSGVRSERDTECCWCRGQRLRGYLGETGRGRAPEAEPGEEKDGVMGKRTRRKVTRLGVS